MLSILRPKTEEIRETWVELNDEEQCYLFCSPTVSTDVKLKRLRDVLHVSCMRQAMNAYKISDGKLVAEKTYGGIMVVWTKILKHFRNICD